MKERQLPPMPRNVTFRYEYTFIYSVAIGDKEEIMWVCNDDPEWHEVNSDFTFSALDVPQDAKIELVERYHNRFDRYDDFLSATLRSMLNTNRQLEDMLMRVGNTKVSPDIPIDTQLFAATMYIREVIAELDADDKALYKRHIAQSIKNNIIVPSKGNPDRFVTKTVEHILDAIGEEYDSKTRIITQLNRLIGTDKDEILHQLTTDANCIRLARKLDEFGNVYAINNSLSQRRLGILFLKFCDNCDLIRTDLKGNVKRILDLMAAYYDCMPPKYRLAELQNYVESGNAPLYQTIVKEQPRFWDYLND